MLVALAALVSVAVVAGKMTFTSARFFDQEVSSNNALQAIGGWMDFAWHWRTPITVNSASSLSNYQLRITINTAALVSAGKMQASGNDIRFTGSDGLRGVSYWIESGINTPSTVLWVRVPSVPSGTSTIYMYYGNASALAASSGDGTFIFFDDFENGLALGTKWTVTNPNSGTISLSNTNVLQGRNSLRVTDSPNGLNLGVSANFTPQTSCVIDYAVYFSLQGSKEIQVLDPAGNMGPRGAFVKSKGGANTLQYYVTDWNTVGNFAASTWYRSSIVVADTMTTTDNYSLYFNSATGSPVTQVLNVPYYRNANLAALGRFTYVGTSDARTDTYLDLVKVRAYAAIEPTYSLGVEQ